MYTRDKRKQIFEYITNYSATKTRGVAVCHEKSEKSTLAFHLLGFLAPRIQAQRDNIARLWYRAYPYTTTSNPPRHATDSPFFVKNNY